MNDKKLTLEEIKARVKVVCICRGIKQGRICDAIASGSDTIEKVNQKTGSGSGGCKATRCGPFIKMLLACNGKPLTEPYKIEVEDDD